MEVISCQPLLDKITNLAIKNDLIRKFKLSQTCKGKIEFCQSSILQCNESGNALPIKYVYIFLENLY